MRKLILLPFFFSAALIFFSSCKKDSRDAMVISTSEETINVKIAPNQPYEMIVTDAGSVSINKQANHFLLSETKVSTETGFLVYKYIPATDYIGSDEVVLLSTKMTSDNTGGNSGGCPGGNNDHASSTTYKYTSLKITIGN